MDDEFVTLSLDLPGGAVKVRQLEVAAELPDDGLIEWAPIAPFWSVLWRCGVELAREVDESDVDGLRIVELGCGLGLPSIAAARGGASVLATDISPEGLEMAAHNAEINGVGIETAPVDWNDAEELIARGPFDLVLAADVLYEIASAGPLLDLLPRLAPRAWIADPGRKATELFLDGTGGWKSATSVRGVVNIHHIELAAPRPPAATAP